MWAGMSSSPSTVCSKYSAPSGTARSNQAAKSRRTSGLAFSLSVSDAEVWRRNRWARPTRTSPSSGTASATSSVTRWKPRERARSRTSRWCHTRENASGGGLRGAHRQRAGAVAARSEGGVDGRDDGADEGDAPGGGERPDVQVAHRDEEGGQREQAGEDGSEIAQPAAGEDRLPAA